MTNLNKQEAIKKLFFDEYSAFGEIEIVRVDEQTNIVKGLLKQKNKISTIEVKYSEKDLLNVMEGKK